MNSVNGDAPKSNSSNEVDGGEIFIHRLDRKTGFTKIDNDIRASGLSLPAIGLHTYLQTLPQDWRINCDHIMRETRTGERPFWRYWNELRNAGYIVVRRPRLPDGRLGKPKIYVYPMPQHHCLRNPHSGGTTVCEIHTVENVDNNKDEKVTKTRKEQRRERDNEEESSAGILSGPVKDAGLRITEEQIADLERVFRNIPNIEAEIFSSTPWVTKRAAENGGDFMGPLMNVLKKADARYALLRQKEERDAPEDIRSW
jgi:hypothetical protein